MNEIFAFEAADADLDELVPDQEEDGAEPIISEGEAYGEPNSTAAQKAKKSGIVIDFGVFTRAAKISPQDSPPVSPKSSVFN